MTKIANVVGARPQFIKVAPILQAINVHNERGSNPVEHILIHTGQHYDYELSQAFFVDLDLPKPDYNLGVGSGSHGEQTGEMLKKLEKVMLKEQPDLVMVYGDTNSTLAAALAAVKVHIPIAHVEAGLREYDKKIPEEVNRLLTDHVSALLFCPTYRAVENLRREGFENVAVGGKLVSLDKLNDLPPFELNHPLVINVGDVMYDSVLYNIKLAEKHSNIIERLHLVPNGLHQSSDSSLPHNPDFVFPSLNKPNKPHGLNEPNELVSYALATVHRAENTDNPNRLVSIFSAFDRLAQQGLKIILPLHPRTRKALENVPQGDKLLRNLEVIDPVPYKDMLVLEKNARVILTDSGGVQKEAYWFGVPCVTMREVTGWVETVEMGWNHLVDVRTEAIVGETLGLVQGSTPVSESRATPYGDGCAANRIIQLIRDAYSKKWDNH